MSTGSTVLQAADLALFETGRVFLPPTPEEPGADGGPTGVVLPAEPHLLGLVACGEFVPSRFDGPGRAVDFFDLLGAVEVARRAVGRGGWRRRRPPSRRITPAAPRVSWWTVTTSA